MTKRRRGLTMRALCRVFSWAIVALFLFASDAWPQTTTLVVFESDEDEDGDFDIYTMNTDGTNRVNRTEEIDDDEGVADDRYPVFCGNKIAFSRDTNGTWDVYVMKLDGSDLTNLTPFTEGSSEIEPNCGPTETIGGQTWVV
jgi:Tol biopolymer transport system component